MILHDIHNFPLLQAFELPEPSVLPAADLAGYVYAIGCCRAAASVSDDASRRRIVVLCDRYLAKIDPLMKDKGTKKAKTASVDLEAFSCLDDPQLTVAQLIGLHSMSQQITAFRYKRKMETYTRVAQWRIVDALFKRDKGSPLAHLLLLAECLEAANRSADLGLPYRMGDRPEPFMPSQYSSDEALIELIRQLSEKRTYLSREALIDIADYIQTEIVETGTTADHVAVVSAILDTGMPSFRYPVITKALEKATALLAKTKSRTRIELAGTYYILWTKTLKQSYLHQFQTTVRHCYSTLADGRQYPGLGVDSSDPRSLTAAIRFLDDHRQTLWTLNDRYDLDKVIRKYHDFLPNTYSAF